MLYGSVVSFPGQLPAMREHATTDISPLSSSLLSSWWSLIPHGILNVKAQCVRYEKLVYPEASIQEIVVWRLPSYTHERPHGYKYRLNYCLSDGTTLVRYDNRAGKADHKHIGGIQLPYEYKSLDELIRDFNHDVQRARKGL